MRQLFSLFIIALFSFGVQNNSVAQTVTLGTGVNVPVLSVSNVHSLFNVVSGHIIQDIIVDGDLEITDLDGFTFYSISITGGNITLNTAPAHGAPIFRGCEIMNGNSLVMVYGAEAIFIGTKVANWELVEIKGGSIMSFTNMSQFVDIDNFEINEFGLLYSDASTFDNSPITTTGPFYIFINDCNIINNTTAAITLQVKGIYQGLGNIFHDNDIAIQSFNNAGFIYFSEKNSLFYDHLGQCLSLRGVHDIEIINNQFIEDLPNGNVIGISGGMGVTNIEENDIDGSYTTSRGLSILNRRETNIINNIVEGVSGEAMYFSFVKGLVIDDNELLNNTDAKGIILNGCTNAKLISNNATEHKKNIDLFLSDNCLLMSNICSQASDANIYVTNSQSTILCDNLAYKGNDGIVISGTNLNLEMNDNAITYCDRGLVYTQDVFTNAQIEKGNYFFLNSLGAEFEDQTDQDLINIMRYVVTNSQAGYPSHSPSAWFQPTGTTELVCDTMDLSPNDTTVIAEPDVNNLFICGGLLAPDGMCTNNLMLALQLIEKNPEFLNAEDIEDLYNLYKETSVDSLPTIQDIHSNLIEGESLTIPVIETDTNGIVQNLEDLYNYFVIMDENYNVLTDSQELILNGLITDVNNLTSNDSYEENYSFSSIEILEMLNGNLPDSTTLIKIVDLAEGCIAVDGPGVYLAQILANTLKIGFIKADSCPSITLRSDINQSTNKVALSNTLFPNPTTDYITIPGVALTTEIVIRDSFGRLVIKSFIETNSPINISHLSPGIYFLEMDHATSWIKFVKM